MARFKGDLWDRSKDGNRREERSFARFAIIATAVFVLFITIILCSLEDVYFAAYSLERENKYAEYGVYVLRQTGNIFSVVCCGAVLALTSQTLVDRELKREVEYLQYTISQGQRQYEMSKDTMDMINIKYHDIKYKLNALLAQNGAAEQAAEEIINSIAVYDAGVSTGNKALDVLLTEKRLYCEQNGINFSCMADGGKLSFMSEGDLYCLFGNIMDNAIEAVGKVEEADKKVISLSVQAKNGMICVQCENYFAGALTFADGLPQTTKSDKAYHGFGMRSIRLIVTKYGGAITTCARDGIFYLNIIFSPRN